MTLRYTDRARCDVEDAVAWYEMKQSGLGRLFLRHLEQAILRIAMHPASCQIYYRTFRGCPVYRFPYLVFYTLETNEIVVHSVFPCRQSPGNRP